VSTRLRSPGLVTSWLITSAALGLRPRLTSMSGKSGLG
jgi:hypothetical protein